MKNDKEKFKNNLPNKNAAFRRVSAGLNLTQYPMLPLIEPPSPQVATWGLRQAIPGTGQL